MCSVLLWFDSFLALQKLMRHMRVLKLIHLKGNLLLKLQRQNCFINHQRGVIKK